MLKRTKIGIGLALLITGAAAAYGPVQEAIVGPSQIHTHDAFNTSNDRKLVGFSDNVFVGEVLEQTGSSPNTHPPEVNSTGFSPQTQFSVRVLENIKGDLDGTITVSQYGGYDEGELELVEGDTLLEPGQRHLFVTRYNQYDDWHTIVTPNKADIPINSQEEYDRLVERFQQAYEEQVVVSQNRTAE